MFKKYKSSLIYLTLLTSLSLTLLNTAPIAAVNILPECTGSAASSSVCHTGTGNPIVGPNGIITKATLIISFIVGILAVVMVLISAFRFITSSGNPETVAGARNTLIYSLVGVAVAALGVVIVEFVLSKV